MLYEFAVTYKSGREEVIKTSSGVKARKIREDLVRARSIGAVVSYKVDEHKNTESARKKALTAYLDNNTRQNIISAAASNGRSISSEISARLTESA